MSESTKKHQWWLIEPPLGGECDHQTVLLVDHKRQEVMGAFVCDVRYCETRVFERVLTGREMYELLGRR